MTPYKNPSKWSGSFWCLPELFSIVILKWSHGLIIVCLWTLTPDTPGAPPLVSTSTKGLSFCGLIGSLQTISGPSHFMVNSNDDRIHKRMKHYFVVFDFFVLINYYSMNDKRLSTIFLLYSEDLPRLPTLPSCIYSTSTASLRIFFRSCSCLCPAPNSSIYFVQTVEFGIISGNVISRIFIN